MTPTRRRPLKLYSLSPHSWRFFPGDTRLRAAARAIRDRLIEQRRTGLGKVVGNLSLGLRRLRIAHVVNAHIPLRPDPMPVGLLAGPLSFAKTLLARTPAVVGPGVLTYPEDWPTMFSESRALLHVQACAHAEELYRPFWGDRIRRWAVGIDTDTFVPTSPLRQKPIDFLVYEKLQPPYPSRPGLLEHCLAELRARRLSYEIISYGRYVESSYLGALARCKTMLFLTAQESQGIAYNEAMAAGVPILAWDHGPSLDPKIVDKKIWMSSVPYFDERCGRRFQSEADFATALGEFMDAAQSGRYDPRAYVLDNLSLEGCARRYLEIMDEADGMLDR